VVSRDETTKRLHPFCGNDRYFVSTRLSLILLYQATGTAVLRIREVTGFQRHRRTRTMEKDIPSPRRVKAKAKGREKAYDSPNPTRSRSSTT